MSSETDDGFMSEDGFMSKDKFFDEDYLRFMAPLSPDYVRENMSGQVSLDKFGELVTPILKWQEGKTKKEKEQMGQRYVFNDEIDFGEYVLGALIDSKGVGFKDWGLAADDWLDGVYSAIYQVLDDLVTEFGFFDLVSIYGRLNPEHRSKFDLTWSLGGFQAKFLFSWIPQFLQQTRDKRIQAASESGDVARITEIVALTDERLKSFVVSEQPDTRFDLQLAMNEIINPTAKMPSCFKELNDMIVGFRPSGLYVVGARPGVGKTVVGMQLAWQLSVKYATCFFSLEMSKTQLFTRVYSTALNIPLSRLENGQVTPKDKLNMQDLISSFDRKLVVSDLGGQTIAQFRAYLLKLKATYDFKVIVIDYLQLISATNSKSSKYEQVSGISVDLKNLAKELDIAIIALAQLNRRVDSGKADDRPVASDLRDSGQIEQDADVIVMLSREQNDDDKFRDDRINSDPQYAKLNGELMSYKSVMRLDVVKNRHGRTGMFKAKFDGDYSRIVEF